MQMPIRDCGAALLRRVPLIINYAAKSLAHQLPRYDAAQHFTPLYHYSLKLLYSSARQAAYACS